MTSILPTPKRFALAKTYVDKDTPGAVTLPQVFKEAGYTTLSNGKIFHFGSDTQDRSWSEKAWHSGMSHSTSLDKTSHASKSAADRSRIYEAPDVPDNAYGDGKVAEKAIADLRQLKDRGNPFFLACGFIRPHMPFYARRNTGTSMSPKSSNWHRTGLVPTTRRAVSRDRVNIEVPDSVNTKTTRTTFTE